MSEEETQKLKEKNVAKLIAALPFLAECEDAERTAVSHLGTYILSLRETKHYFNATSGDNDSVFKRLRLISNFKGGKKEIIARGMSILALNMVDDYKRDVTLDEIIGKYNPVGDRAWDYEKTREKLIKTIEAIDCPEMDTIYSEGPGTMDWWGL
jgi:hypothetical protein